MRKKEKLFEYLKDHISIDLNGIEAIKQQPNAKIDFVGGVERWYLTSFANYYPECKNAIKNAGKIVQNCYTWNKKGAAIKMLHVKQTNVKRYNSKMLHVKHLDRNVTQ